MNPEHWFAFNRGPFYRHIAEYLYIVFKYLRSSTLLLKV